MLTRRRPARILVGRRRGWCLEGTRYQRHRRCTVQAALRHASCPSPRVASRLSRRGGVADDRSWRGATQRYPAVPRLHHDASCCSLPPRGVHSWYQASLYGGVVPPLQGLGCLGGRGRVTLGVTQRGSARAQRGAARRHGVAARPGGQVKRGGGRVSPRLLSPSSLCSAQLCCTRRCSRHPASSSRGSGPARPAPPGWLCVRAYVYTFARDGGEGGRGGGAARGRRPAGWARASPRCPCQARARSHWLQPDSCMFRQETMTS